MLRSFKSLVAAFTLSALLQLLSLKLGSAVVKYELLGANQIYFCEAIPPNSINSSSHSAAYCKPAAQSDTVTDIDGNVYHVVKIGKQRWMQENLKATHFRNGYAIPELEYNNDWPFAGNAAWCYYERDAQNNDTYGKLYNWYVVSGPGNVCPAGWHVPSDQEFQLLSDFLGGDDISGAHMKAIKLWDERDEKIANNSSGFTALPAGMRYWGGSFGRPGADGADFWSTTDYTPNTAICRILYYGGSKPGHHYLDKRSGLSVRCVGD
jgi:uncharacterized protein (TIGR02145 family)